MPKVEAVQDRIDGMVGLDVVKDEIDAIITSALADNDRRARGKKVIPQDRNMILAGPPGTGKTTIAREIAPLFSALGLTDNEKFVQVTADDLKSEFVGGSAKQAKKIVESAKGGVLFIDEAYQLISGDKDEYGKEAVAAILPMIEDPKTVVILGGYEDEIRAMMAGNSGMPSRFGTTLHFEPYTLGERAEILANMFEANDYVVPAETKKAMLKAVRYTGQGNARDVQRLSEKVLNAYNRRVVEAGFGDDVITASDVFEGGKAYAVSASSDGTEWDDDRD